MVWLAVALLYLSAGATRAQQTSIANDCNTESELLGHLHIVREACTVELSTAEVDALVPTQVTTAGCAEVVRRVARQCKPLFRRSPRWFQARKNSLDAAVASAAATIPDVASERLHIADPRWNSVPAPQVHTCGAVLDDGFDLFPPVTIGSSLVPINVGSHGNVILDFADISLDERENDNVRIYNGAGNEVMQILSEGRCDQMDPATCRDLASIQEHPRVTVTGPEASVRLVSTGGNNSLTSLQITVGCLCEGGACDPSPCNGNPCHNGGMCAPSNAGLGGHRRLQASSGGGYGDGDSAACTLADFETRSDAVDTACCGDPSNPNNCIGGAPSTCNNACREVLVPFWEDCSAKLQGEISQVVQNTATQVCVAGYQCTCTAGWGGVNCETSTSPSPPPDSSQCGTCPSGTCPHTPGEGPIGEKCYMWQPAPGHTGNYADCCEVECTYETPAGQPYGPHGPLPCTADAGQPSQMDNHKKSCEAQAGWEWLWANYVPGVRDGDGPWRCCRL
eukprot:COSAG02_NODE_1633_length_11567_cov_16.719567_7_plen_508_part_00